MSETKSLLEGSVAPEITELLRSAELDVPPAHEERQARILMAIGASGRALVNPLPPTSPTARFGRLLSVGKWSVPLLGLVAAGLLATSSRSPESGAVASAATSAAPTTPRTEPAPPPSAAPVPVVEATAHPSVRVEDLPSVVADGQRLTRPRPEAPVGRAEEGAARSLEAPSPTLNDEISLIDAARGSLAEGRAADALSQLRAYRSRFTNPRFADEADTLEIQALAALGRTDEARAQAERFLATRPQSPYVRRIRSAAGLKE